MGKRGTKKRNFVPTVWNSDFAYCLGLLATDGNLSPDLRHMSFTSKDKELVVLFKKTLALKNKIGIKANGSSKEKRYFVIQFGSIQFFSFLLSIGMMPAKSKKLQAIEIPDVYFWDFLRGCFDGDGNINEFTHPESDRMQLRIRFSSASERFLSSKLRAIRRLSNISGGWLSRRPYKSTFSLTFGKSDSIKILELMYKNAVSSYLKRKFAIAKKHIFGYKR